MADNLPPVRTPLFALSDHAIVALEGVDAVAFAQAQFANDVTALPVGQWQWNAWLTPKGRVIALFALIKRSPEQLLLLVPDYPAEVLAAQLQRFVFRRKLKIAARPDLPVSGAPCAPVSARTAQIGMTDGGIELDLGAADSPRTGWIGAADATQDAGALAAWVAEDLRHGLPRLPASQREQWTPQQLSLDRLHAYSVRKGCYPGQEIVARTHFLGKAKRGLALFEAAAPIAEGNGILEEGAQEIGTVIRVQAHAARWLALAVLPLDRPRHHLTAADVALVELPLLDGLQR